MRVGSMSVNEQLVDREQLRDYLMHTVCDPRAIGELKEYVRHSFERFMITLELLPQTTGHILELGATPYFTTILMQRFRPGYQLELSNFFGDRVANPDVIHQVTVENLKYGEERIFYYRQFNVEGQPFPYPDKHFDGILFCEILEHLTHDPIAALLECHRVLKPGGWLLLTTPNFARYDNLVKLWRGINPSDQYSGYGPYGRHNREYTLSEVKLLLEGVGFGVQQLKARSIDLPVEESWLHRIMRRLRPSHSYEEHIFCLAERTKGAPTRNRPAWLYRSLPQEPVSHLPHEEKEVRTMDKNRMTVSLINLNLVSEDATGACIINQARFFRRRGDDVRVYVLHPPKNVPADVEAVTSVVTLKDLIGGGQEHFSNSDLFIYHYPSRHELMESIRGIDRGTVIFYYHNVTPPSLWGSDTDREILIQGVEGSSLVHYADVCITDSLFNKEDLVERVGYAADRIFVVPLAIPLEHLTPGEKDQELIHRYGLEGQQVLLFVGRMAGNKRIDLLVEALAQIKSQVPNTKLLLVGDADSSLAYRTHLATARARATELEIEQDVIVAGQVAELGPHYRLADVYVTASLHEGFGQPLIEAMACGVPVVASRAGAMPWVVSDAGLLCTPGSADELAEKVLAVLTDKSLRQSLIARGLERAQEFSVEAYEAALSDIVERAVTYTLPRIARSEPRAGQTSPSRSVSQEAMLLSLLADELEAKGDIASRDYVVRSRAPLIGPLIAWVRRNMTSHLREPYLDPMVERQVEVNDRIAEWMKRAAFSLRDSAQRQTELEEQVLNLEAKLEDMAQRLIDVESQKEH